MARAGALVALVGTTTVLAGPAAAQPTRHPAPGPTLELRADAAVDQAPAALAGGGLLVDAGGYVRLGVLATAGVAYARDGSAGLRQVRPAGEVALVGRFLLDPFRQAARGVYAGGGVAVRAADGDGRPFVLLAVGVEGRARGRTAPAVELGLGHGVRLGVALRRARPGLR